MKKLLLVLCITLCNFYACAQELLKPGGAAELGVSSFTAVFVNGQVNVSWQTLSEHNVSEFKIERAGDESIFTNIGALPAYGNSNSTKNYVWTDGLPLDGINYYRLVKLNKDGSAVASAIVYVDAQMPANDLVVGPNPVTSGNVAIHNCNLKQLSIKIYNRNGKVVYERQDAPQHGCLSFDTSSLQPGLYYCLLEGDNTFVKKELVILPNAN